MLDKLVYSKDTFVKAITVLGLALCIHIVCMLLESGLPFALVYGPILFCSQLSFHQNRPVTKRFSLHFIPFLVFFVFYLFINDNDIRRGMEAFYYISYFAVTFISLSSYSILIWVHQKKWQVPINKAKGVLINQLSVLTIIISVTMFILLVNMLNTLSFDISPQSIIYILMLLAVMLIFKYVYHELIWEYRLGSISRDKVTSRKNVSPSLPEKTLKEYEKRLHHCLVGKQLYLRSDLSLDLLSQETGIPKHHASILFNVHLGKSFYHLLAKYRIHHAMSLLQRNGDSLTIESLAYECGFNSKTSFNKYFKEITTLSPSDFRDRHNTLP